MLSSILYTLCFVAFGFIMADSNGAVPSNQGEGQQWMKNYIQEKWQVVAANDKTKPQIAREEDDFVTEEELDEAVSTLTSMIDVLSGQILGNSQAILTNTNDILTNTNGIAELVANTVERCETGEMHLLCVEECCYIYPSETCIKRDSYDMTFPVIFQKAFGAVPILTMSGVANAALYRYGQPITEGFWYWADKTKVTTSGFNIAVKFDVGDMAYRMVYYTFNWIACQ